jgi:hypothetical protein
MKKPSSAAKKTPVAKSASAGTRRPLLPQHPQSPQVAAASTGMFLRTTDAWSLAYFDNNDLHFKERELFG